jgi:hypothetical protein
MNLMRIGVLLGILVTVGCASHPPFPQSSLTGGVFEVKIGESLTLPVVIAKLGDEVRWVNMSNGPVDISLVQTREDLISCQQGFASTDLGNLFGSLEYETMVIATVLPNESANLCFAIPGKYVYTIRRNPPITGHANTITGSVRIE